MKLCIVRQYFPDHLGNRPMSWAIYLRRNWWRRDQFCCYAFSLGRAYQALLLLQKTLEG